MGLTLVFATEGVLLYVGIFFKLSMLCLTLEARGGLIYLVSLAFRYLELDRLGSSLTLIFSRDLNTCLNSLGSLVCCTVFRLELNF